MTPLTTETVAAQLIELAANALGKDVSEISRTQSLREQGIDSFMFAELVFEVEDIFGIDIIHQQEALAGIDTVDQIAAFILVQLGQK